MKNQGKYDQKLQTHFSSEVIQNSGREKKGKKNIWLVLCIVFYVLCLIRVKNTRWERGENEEVEMNDVVSNPSRRAAVLLALQ